jgi:hypothetical protein
MTAYIANLRELLSNEAAALEYILEGAPHTLSALRQYACTSEHHAREVARLIAALERVVEARAQRKEKP